MDSNFADFSRSVRTARNRACLSLDEAAQGICSPSYLSLIEAGKRQPSQKIINALAEKLKIAPIIRFSDLVPSRYFVSIEASIKLGDFTYAKTRISDLTDPMEKFLATGLLRAAKGEYQSAVTAFQHCIEIGPAHSWVHFQSALGLTKAHRDLGNFQKSIALGEAVYSEYKSSKHASPDEVVELKAILASSYLEIGDLNRARELSRLPSDLPADNWQAAMSMWSTAMIEESAGNYADASEAAKKALALVKSLGRPLSEARLLNISASMELQLGSPDLEKAAKQLAKAEEILRRNSFTVDLAACLATKAELASYNGNKEATGSLFSESLELLSNIEHESRGRIQAAAASSFQRLGDTKECLKYLLLARETLETKGADRNAAKVWHLMGQIYEELGDSVAALACLKASTELLGMPATRSKTAIAKI